jgi:hypothetical protein
MHFEFKSDSKHLNMSTQTNQSLLYDTSLTFLNTFLIRVFADFFHSTQHIKQIQNKIQNKLNKISVPYFMESLVINDLSLGSVIPLIKQTSEPWHDDKGLWVHLEIEYSGGIQMSLATKLNLMKLKSSSNSANSIGPSTSTSNLSMFSFKNLSNSDEEQVSNGSPTNSSPPSSADNSFNTSNLNTSASQASISSDKLKQQKLIKKNHKRHLAITNSDEEDSPESSGDEYVHSGFNDEDNKLIET